MHGVSDGISGGDFISIGFDGLFGGSDPHYGLKPHKCELNSPIELNISIELIVDDVGGDREG